METFNAFSISPVPAPGPSVKAPELFQGIYGMPMLITVPSADLRASSHFWCEALGFFEFYSLPGQIIHLRRWAFQDVLLVPGEPPERPGPGAVTFACVEGQIDPLSEACQRLAPGSASEPRLTPWGTLDLTVTTPENTLVTMSAARPYDPQGQQAQYLRDTMGIEGPDA